MWYAKKVNRDSTMLTIQIYAVKSTGYLSKMATESLGAFTQSQAGEGFWTPTCCIRADERERENGYFQCPIQSSILRATLPVVVLLSVKILSAEDDSERSGERAMGTRAIDNLLTSHCKTLMLISIISIIFDFIVYEMKQYTRLITRTLNLRPQGWA